MFSQFVFVLKIKIKRAFPLLVHMRFLFSLFLIICAHSLSELDSQACITILFVITVLTIAISTPFIYFGRKDHETPIFNYTYIGCNGPLQFDVRQPLVIF